VPLPYPPGGAGYTGQYAYDEVVAAHPNVYTGPGNRTAEQFLPEK
jgi:hypothetical protein